MSSYIYTYDVDGGGSAAATNNNRDWLQCLKVVIGQIINS